MRWTELSKAYRGRRVLVTGHTGFKGSWLTALLLELGADVCGLSLEPEKGGVFDSLGLARRMDHRVVDVRDRQTLHRLIRDSSPEVIFHLAAQSLVSRGYEAPADTLETNVMGTVNLLESLRFQPRTALVLISSDKCYHPQNGRCAVGDPLGGRDPYSASKAAMEIIVEAYRSVFPVASISTARAGNAIGGGDQAPNRLLPDIFRALESGGELRIRNPNARRPWQFVLDVLWGYLMLGSKLLDGEVYACSAWNFGPQRSLSVEEVLAHCLELIPRRLHCAVRRKRVAGNTDPAPVPRAHQQSAGLAVSDFSRKKY